MMRFDPHVILEHAGNQGRPGRTADEDDLVDRLGEKHGVLQAGMDGAHRLAEQRPDHLLVFFPGYFHIEMAIPGDKFFPDRRERPVGEGALGLSTATQRRFAALRSLFQVNAVLFLKGQGDMIDQEPIEVIAAKVGVAVAGSNFHDAVFHLHKGSVEGSPTQIVNEYPLFLLVTRLIGQGSRRRLVDNPDHVEPRQDTCLRVACRWASSKYAGTVMTAFSTF